MEFKRSGRLSDVFLSTRNTCLELRRVDEPNTMDFTADDQLLFWISKIQKVSISPSDVIWQQTCGLKYATFTVIFGNVSCRAYFSTSLPPYSLSHILYTLGVQSGQACPGGMSNGAGTL